MSLTNRIRDIERRLTALERGQQDVAQALVDVVDALPDDPDEEQGPTLTLDGEDVGGERDQSQEL